MASSALCLLLLHLSLSYYEVESKAADHFFRKDYTYMSDFQNFYKLHTIKRSWWGAKRRCAMEGAKLWFPEDKAEADAGIALWKQQRPYAWVHIGVNDPFGQREFQTINGTPLDEVFHDWDDVEPNNLGGAEDCVVLNERGKLNDEDCRKIYPFICKKTLASLEWNSLCDLPDMDYQYDSNSGKCYKFNLRPMNWTDAYGVCAAEQSYLAVINSQSEADHLVKMTADADKDKVRGNYLRGAVHLGFHNREGDGFITIKGIRLEDSGYSTWGNGQPDNTGGNELCGSMFYNGGLNDISCDVVSFFICEHDIGFLRNSIDERILAVN